MPPRPAPPGRGGRAQADPGPYRMRRIVDRHWRHAADILGSFLAAISLDAESDWLTYFPGREAFLLLEAQLTALVIDQVWNVPTTGDEPEHGY